MTSSSLTVVADRAPVRGYVHYASAGPRVLAGMALMTALAAYLFDQSAAIFRLWSMMFEALTRATGVASSIVMSVKGGLLANVKVGVLATTGPSQALMTAALGGALLFLSLCLPRNRVPARYGLAALGIVLAVPAAIQAWLSLPVQFDLASQVAFVFKTGYWFVLATPLVLALTAFVLPGNLVARALLAAAAVTYLVLTVPLLALLHLHVLVWLGVAWLPLLNLGFTVLVLSFIFICFYGLMASVR